MGPASQAGAFLGEAWRDRDGFGMPWIGVAWPGSVRQGTASAGKTRRGVPRSVLATPGEARHAMARPGAA